MKGSSKFMEKLNLSKLKVNSAKSYLFIMLPQELITNPTFDDIHYGSKILYGMMLNRSGLSATNPDFIDKSGDVFIIYTIEQVMETMRCSNKTAVNMLKQLENIGLIEKKRRGQGKASLIYVKDFSTLNAEFSTEDAGFSTENENGNLQKCENYTSENVKFTFHDVNFLHTSHINQKNQNLSEIESIYQAEVHDNDLRLSNKDDKHNFDDNSYINLNFDNLKHSFYDKTNDVEEIRNLIFEVISSRERTFRIGRKNLPDYEVKSALRKLDNRHIAEVLNSLNNREGIKNYKNYLLTSLYNISNKTFFDTEAIKRNVRENIDYDNLLNDYVDDANILNSLYRIVVETLSSHKKTLRIGKKELPIELICDVFNRIDRRHVEDVLISFNNSTRTVKSPHSFFQTALYNSVFEVSDLYSLDLKNQLHKKFGINPK
jgi:hypothetical protein